MNATTEPRYGPALEAAVVNSRFGLAAARLFVAVLRWERAWALVIAEKKLGELLGLDDTVFRQTPVEKYLASPRQSSIT